MPEAAPAPVLRIVPLPYAERLPLRDAADIDLIVVHCTETPTLAVARQFGECVLYPESGTGACGHYYIDRDGALERYVEAGRIANHTRGHNPRSIGIELVNTGRWPHWYDSRHQGMDEPYTAAQLEALMALLATLCETFPSLRFIAGHEDLDTARVPASDDPALSVWRKRDPGPQFPWPQVLGACGLTRLGAA